MVCRYELAILGRPSEQQIHELELHVSQCVADFGMRIGEDVSCLVTPTDYTPTPSMASAAVFYGARECAQDCDTRLPLSIPIIPVVSEQARFMEEIPVQLHRYNCLSYADGGVNRVTTALLECVGLLPRQRRVFVSYRRNQARGAALQLYDELSARQFDVFLDTHGIPPAVDFQAMLWHRLSDSDVLVMLDTPDYFHSRWTSAEFGRVLAKGIAILRVAWPNCTPSERSATASPVELQLDDIEEDTGRLATRAIERICQALEMVRSQSHAIRTINLITNVKLAIEKVGGNVTGIGMNHAIYATLPGSESIVVFPSVGVPTSLHLHEASTTAPKGKVAVVYDHVGLHPAWLQHLEWLGTHIVNPRWVKAAEAAWDFAAWEG